MRPIYKILFSLSVVMVVASIISLAAYGFNFGVDFKGGSVLELDFTQRPATAEVAKILNESNIANVKDAGVSPVGDSEIIIKSGELSEKDHQDILAILKKAFLNTDTTEKRFDSVGPLIGNELKNKSITAIIVVLVAISLYITFVFKKLGRVLPAWVMGAAAIIALIHDLVIPMGIFAWLGAYKGVEISAVFVAAVLTILGYSISDTVVIFDRVRENILRGGSKEQFSEVVHQSIMQTLVRSLNTTLTTLLSLVTIYFFGGESVKYFALALILGISLGAFSSIAVASPILVWWSRRRAG
ncbi:MAG: protein translocase subunit SecF [Patescibacteria group bacterium]